MVSAGSTQPKTATKAAATAKSTASTRPRRKPAGGDTSSSSSFTAEERAAMKDRADELKAQRGGKKVDGETDLRQKIEAMPEGDRELATRVHEVIMAAAPGLEQKTWYGMPAYAKDGQTICFFQNAGKFKARYSMLGFSDKAALDDGGIWPVYYAIPAMTSAVEKKITEIITMAVG